MKALVIGGTGPTGPHIINGLIARGYQVAMLNRGSRDSSAIPADVERLIGDPHFPDTLEEVLKGRTFDLVIATYGRIRYVAEVLVGKTERLITIGGPPSYKGFVKPETVRPVGMPSPVQEDDERVSSMEEDRFSYLIRQTEDAVMAQHDAGHLNVTHYRYPVVYGPWQVQPMNFWWIMQRCLDGRSRVAIADGGLTIATRGYSENMAEAVLLAVDQPEASAGQIYNCGDIRQFSLRQWVQLISEAMDRPVDVISIPDAYASPSRDIMMFRGRSQHQLLDIYKIRQQLGYQDRVDAVTAVEKTVAWVRDNPPEEGDFIDSIRAHYETEDKLIDIYDRAAQEMAGLNHDESAFHHSYAHPKERGLARDHRNR